MEKLEESTLYGLKVSIYGTFNTYYVKSCNMHKNPQTIVIYKFISFIKKSKKIGIIYEKFTGKGYGSLFATTSGFLEVSHG